MNKKKESTRYTMFSTDVQNECFGENESFDAKVETENKI